MSDMSELTYKMNTDQASPEVRAMAAIQGFLVACPDIDAKAAYEVLLSCAAEILAQFFLGDLEGLIKDAPNALRTAIVHFTQHNPELVAAKRQGAQ